MASAFCDPATSPPPSASAIVPPQPGGEGCEAALRRARARPEPGRHYHSAQIEHGLRAATVSAAIAAGVLLGGFAMAEPLPTASFETAAAIHDLVTAAVSPRLAAFKDASVEIEIGAFDPRLRLPACPAADIELPPVNHALMTAKVSCAAPVWTLYVPVRLHAWIDAVVAAVNLMPETTLGSADLTRGRVDLLAQSGGLLTDPAEAAGKVLRVGLPAGAPVLSPFLEAPVVIHRGQKVLLTLDADTMTIRAPALALEDGRVGQSIEVENPDSKKTIRATVVDDGSVEMHF
jgi:flagellar basal body P-ring formation protein FlgA